MTYVQGLAELERRWSRIPGLVRAATREAMEEVAGRIVADMNHAKPLVQIDIGWTWGAAPAGSMVLGKVGSQDYGAMSITIYARGDDFAASWFEFGTGPRFHKSGKYVGQIAAQTSGNRAFLCRSMRGHGGGRRRASRVWHRARA